jgi:hypothetical protein
MEKKKKRIIGFAAFWLIFLVLFYFFTKLVLPKWNDIPGVAGTRAEDFYSQEENTMDAMFFGSSFIYYSVSPLPIWDDYGITSYTFGNPGQRIWTSYYYMEEAFKYQSPKVVFYEVGTSYMEDQAKEEWNRQNLDYMPFSLTKWKAILAMCKGGKETVASYLLPGIRYHDRWQELSENDFDRCSNTGYYGKGSLMRFGAKPATKKKQKEWMQDTGEELTFPEENEAYLDKMIKLCEENGAELVLLRLPNISWTENLNEMMQNLADEKGLTYLDFNTFPEAYGLDWNTDTTDKGDHMNVVGTQKVSRYLGQYLKDHYDFEDKRTDEAYASWVENSEKFQVVYEKNLIANIVDLNEYLEKIQDECYTAVITVKNDVGAYLSDDSKAILSSMGVSDAMMENRGNSYIGILDSGTMVEQMEGSELLTYKKKVGDIKIIAKSGGELYGDTSSTKIDGEEYSAQNVGINIVVYDKELGRVVDSVSFNTTKKNNKISRRLQNNANDEI